MLFNLPGNKLCHPDDTMLVHGRQVACNRCQIVLYPDINDYFLSLPAHSSNQGACVYARETGDIGDLRCKVAIENLEGIFPCEVVVRYDVFLQVIRLLGILNCDFVRYVDSNMFDKEAMLNCKIIDSFLTQLESLVAEEEAAADTPNVDDLISRAEGVKLVKALIGQLKQISQEQECNIVDLFLNVYVPYVCNFHPVTTETRELGNMADYPGQVFLRVCQDADRIRAVYSPYSLQFDLVYVLVFVYLCRSNFEVIFNFLLRLVSQVCAGYFDKPHRLLKECVQLVETKLLRNKRNSEDLQHTIRQLRNGNCEDVLSVETLRHVSSLQALFSPQFRELWSRLGGSDSSQVVSYAESQMFPYVLFGSVVRQYYGFKIVLPFVAKYLDKRSGTLQKHKLAKAKYLMKFVERYMAKMQDFASDDPAIYWTVDMFKLFAGSDENFVQELKGVFEELATESKR